LHTGILQIRNMKRLSFCIGASVIFFLLFISCNNRDKNFIFFHTDQGFELKEGGKPVFFYQSVPKTLTGEYVCTNYFHPLYNLKGDILTEEFPPDHPYHRGVFWTWHQLYIDSVSIGDGWINDGISQDVVKILTEVRDGTAEMDLEVNWFSDTLPAGQPFMKEQTSVVVHPSESNIRKLDFIIRLYSLIDNLEIGGSDDPKGYGGFCLRLNIPDNMIFTSESGKVEPQEMQVSAGRWMDFSGLFGKMQETNGITILCHSENPVFPSPWILRQKGSMQNAVYPGRERVKLSKGVPVILKYRLVIHNGDAQSIDINKLQAEYSNK